MLDAVRGCNIPVFPLCLSFCIKLCVIKFKFKYSIHYSSGFIIKLIHAGKTNSRDSREIEP